MPSSATSSASAFATAASRQIDEATLFRLRRWNISRRNVYATTPPRTSSQRPGMRPMEVIARMQKDAAHAFKLEGQVIGIRMNLDHRRLLHHLCDAPHHIDGTRIRFATRSSPV